MAFTINPPNSPLVNGRGVVDPVWYRFFANIQRVLGDDAVAEIQQAPILTWQPTTALSNERVLIPGYGIDLSLSAPALTVSLEPSGVVAGPYGSATETSQIEVDAAGRVVAAQSIPLISDNVVEGGSNLYFTTQRARESLSGVDGVAYDEATGAISAEALWFGDRFVEVDRGAAWASPTGTGSRASFASYEAPTISNPPTQAEVQAIANALQAATRALKSIVDDLKANRSLTS